MSYVDIGILILILFGIYYGYENGFVKTIFNFVNIYFAMIASALLNKPIYNLLYKILPFHNFENKVLASNIILHRVLIYLFSLIIIALLFERIAKKRKLGDYLLDTAVEAGILSKILGTFTGIILMFIFSYNLLYFFLIPGINVLKMEDSTLSNIVLKNTFIVSNINRNVYNSEIYANIIIKNKKYKSKEKNIMVIKYMINNNVISANNIIKIRDKLKINITDLIRKEEKYEK